MTHIAQDTMLMYCSTLAFINGSVLVLLLQCVQVRCTGDLRRRRGTAVRHNPGVPCALPGRVAYGCRPQRKQAVQEVKEVRAIAEVATN